MNTKNTLKTIVSTSLLIILLVLCGCSGGFEVIEPPVNEFPLAEQCEFNEVITGDFVVEKTFRGNFKYNQLYTTSSTLVDYGFYAGEKGIVTYVNNGETIKLDAVLEATNTKGNFIAKHKELTNGEIKYNWPGEFSVITYQKENCVLVPKDAVILFDEEGNAIVYVKGENDILVEKQIKVGPSNNKYYQVVEGLTPGEKVVLN